MKRARLLLATLFVSGVLVGGLATPASASPLTIDRARTGQLCITFHTGGLLEPIPVCIPLI